MSTQLDSSAICAAALFGLFLLPMQSSGEVTTFQLSMSGDQAVPVPGDPDGQASGTLSLDDVTGLISWTFNYAGIADPTAMHIHMGSAGESGGPAARLNVTTTARDGMLSGSTMVEIAAVESILASPSSYYVNIHNAEYRGGAIRGQLAN